MLLLSRPALHPRCLCRAQRHQRIAVRAQVELGERASSRRRWTPSRVPAAPARVVAAVAKRRTAAVVILRPRRRIAVAGDTVVSVDSGLVCVAESFLVLFGSNGVVSAVVCAWSRAPSRFPVCGS